MSGEYLVVVGDKPKGFWFLTVNRTILRKNWYIKTRRFQKCPLRSSDVVLSVISYLYNPGTTCTQLPCSVPPDDGQGGLFFLVLYAWFCPLR